MSDVETEIALMPLLGEKYDMALRERQNRCICMSQFPPLKLTLLPPTTRPQETHAVCSTDLLHTSSRGHGALQVFPGSQACWHEIQ